MKDKIKDITKKIIVETYQAGLRESINMICAKEEKLKPAMKEYVKKLEENFNRAPYDLGYLEWPDKKKK